MKRGDIDHGVREAIVDCIRPMLRVEQPFAWPSGRKAEEGLDLVGQLLRVEFDTDGHPTAQEVLEAWPSDIEQEVALFRVAERALAAALDQAHDAGHLGRFDRPSHDVVSLSGDGGSLARGFFPIARLAAGLWDRIALKDAARARLLAASWNTAPYLLQTRLYLHTHLSCDVHSGEEVGVVLTALNDRTFWISDAQREAGNLLATRWPDLSEAARSSLEARLCAGLPRGLARPGDTMPEIEWQAISDHLVFRLLEPIRRAGGELTSTALAVLDGIKARHPAASLTLPGEDAVHIGGFTGSRGHPERLAKMPDDALVREALRMQQAEKWGEGGVWQLLCEAEPHRALRAIRATTETADRWRPEIIGPLLSTASRVDDADFQEAMADLLMDMPHEMLPRHAADVAYWLHERAEKGGMNGKLPAQFMPVWDRLADVVYASTADSVIPPGAATMDGALNSTGGRVALAFRTILCARTWLNGQSFDPEMRGRLDRLVNAPGVAGLHARLLFVRVLAFLDRVDPDWTASCLVPRFSWTNPEAGALWTAWAGGSIGSAGLFNAIKAPFLEAFRRHEETEHADEGLAASLVQVAMWKQDPAANAYDLTFSEVRGALSAATPAGRRQAAWQFWRWMAGGKDEVFDRADRWRSRAGPLFNDIWPLNARTRDAGSSRTLVLMALECGDAFPEAVMAVVDFLIPHDIMSVDSSLSLETLHREVIAKFPSSFLRLLNAIVDPKIARVPFDLGAVLDRCRASSPGIKQEPAFIRLDGLRRQREA